ncbi:alpha/beta hydrolase [Rurimicrobium arvi]
MRRKLLFLLTFLLLVCLGLIFIPRQYTVPAFKADPSFQYWDLPTGSHIGYLHIPAKGKAKPYPVIFLQGGPGGFVTPSIISLFSQVANSGYEVFLYDQVGSGHSARLTDIRAYTATRHKEDLNAIVGKTGAEKVILIGQSWGAILATLYTADYPDRVAGIVLSGPGPLIPVNHSLAQIPAPDSLHLKPPAFSNAEANRKVNNWRSKAAAFFALNFGAKLMPDREADAFQTMLNIELNKSTVADQRHLRPALGGGGYYAQLMTVNSFWQTPDPRQKLQHCAVPLLLLKGQYDNQPWGYATEYLGLFPDHRLQVIPNAGHVIQAEQRAAYLSAVLAFLPVVSGNN